MTDRLATCYLAFDTTAPPISMRFTRSVFVASIRHKKNREATPTFTPTATTMTTTTPTPTTTTRAAALSWRTATQPSSSSTLRCSSEHMHAKAQASLNKNVRLKSQGGTRRSLASLPGYHRKPFLPAGVRPWLRRREDESAIFLPRAVLGTAVCGRSKLENEEEGFVAHRRTEISLV